MRTAVALALLVATSSPATAQSGLRREHALAVIDLQPKIDGAIDRGVRWLLDRQNRDGSWSYNDHAFEGGITGLVCYTLLKAGLPTDHSAVRRALAYLELVEPHRIYAAGAILLALCEADQPQRRKQIERFVRRIMECQTGSWTYPNEEPVIPHFHHDEDISITQYALLGLTAAGKQGVKVPPKVWLDALRRGLDAQSKPERVTFADGSTHEIAGFRYQLHVRNQDGNGRVSGGLTCAGITVLHLARQALGKRLPPADDRASEHALAMAHDWLIHNFRVDDNPAHPNGFYFYYLYGLERASSYLGVDYYGERPWYSEGANVLLERQVDDGHWGGVPAGEADTCFAILFLKRVTAPTTGADGSRNDLHVSDDPQHDVAFRGRGGLAGAPLELWVTRIGAADGMRSYAVERVDYLVDGDVAATVAADDPTRTWSGAPFTATVHLPGEGEHRVTARVTARLAAGSELAPATRTLASAGFAVRVRDTWQGWMGDAASVRRDDRLAAGEPTLAASTAVDGHAAANAADHRESTEWRWQADDPQPRLRIDVARPIAGRHVVVGIAPGRLHGAAELDEVRRLQVLVNGGKTGPTVEVTGDRRAPVVIDLGKVQRLRRLELVVLERVAGKARVGGITEVVVTR